MTTTTEAPIASVTSIAPPAFTHSNDCDLRAIGQLVRFVRQSVGDSRTVDSRPTADVLDQFIELAAEYQANGRIACDCGARALGHVEDSLRLARKAVRAAVGNDELDRREARLAALELKRDRIRAALDA